MNGAQTHCPNLVMCTRPWKEQWGRDLAEQIGAKRGRAGRGVPGSPGLCAQGKGGCCLLAAADAHHPEGPPGSAEVLLGSLRPCWAEPGPQPGPLASQACTPGPVLLLVSKVTFDPVLVHPAIPLPCPPAPGWHPERRKWTKESRVPEQVKEGFSGSSNFRSWFTFPLQPRFYRWAGRGCREGSTGCTP